MPEFSKDEAAILALIHANRIAVWTQNYEEYQKCFVHADYTTRWNASHVTGILVREGWDEISSKVRQLFSDYLIDADPEFGRSQAYDTEVLDLKIRVSGDMAWATFRQNYPAASPPSGTAPARAWHRAGSSPSHEVRVFERHSGQWRIAFLGFLDADSPLSASAVLRLSAEGLIEWQSASAAELLLQDDDLIVRNGRLRVRDARTDGRLQAAIKWAAALSAPLIPGRGSLPLVMQAGEGIPAKVWWIIAEGGKVYFSMSNTAQDEHRLEAAAIVYGLSPLQKRVAAQVVAGRQLSEIAVALNVTSNTARTHLDRIFDKVGVRSQAALVRALLSAASPV
jgi:DNA-binding CsgD family transcriptional regulator